MKTKITILILFAFFTISTAQVEVIENGNVGVGLTPTQSAKLQVNLITPDGALSKNGINLTRNTNTLANVTSYDKGINNQLIKYGIPVGVTDGGYKIALDASSYSSNNNFAGTLNRNMAIWARAGIHTAATTAKINDVYAVRAELMTRQGTIENGYGVYIESLYSTGNITNQYDLYAASPEAKNYFAGILGIGTIPSGASKLQIKYITSNGDVNKGGLHVTRGTNASTNVTSYDKAISGQFRKYIIANGMTDSGYKIAVDASSYSSNDGFAGTLNSNMAVWARAGIHTSSSTAKINHAYGVRAELMTRSGTIKNGYGVYIESPYSTGTITNQYDLYASSVEALNYFAGKVGIGTASPTTHLDVNGDAKVDGSLKIGDVINLTAQNAEPANPETGDIYLDDGTNAGGNPTLRYYNGSVWVNL